MVRRGLGLQAVNSKKITNAWNTWCRACLNPGEANPEMGKQRDSSNAQLRSGDNHGTKYKSSASDLGSHWRNRDKVKKQRQLERPVHQDKRLDVSKETPAQNTERDSATQEDFWR